MEDQVDLIFGNLAYDPFGSAVPEFEFPPEEPVRQPQAPEPSEARPRPQERVRIATEEDTAARAAARVRTGIFAAVVIPLAAACLVFLVLLLQAHTRLTAVSSEAARLESRIYALQAERSRLEIQSESVFNMEEVEQKARTSIGMIKADTDQAVFLRSTTEDVAVILSAEGKRDTLLRRVGKLIRRIEAFFR
jgi:cell division protein FtsL